MQKTKEMLIKTGVDESTISSGIVDGGHRADDDILDAVHQRDCGTIVMERRRASYIKDYSMGIIPRKMAKMQPCGSSLKKDQLKSTFNFALRTKSSQYHKFACRLQVIARGKAATRWHRAFE